MIVGNGWLSNQQREVGRHPFETLVANWLMFQGVQNFYMPPIADHLSTICSVWTVKYVPGLYRLVWHD